MFFKKTDAGLISCKWQKIFLTARPFWSDQDFGDGAIRITVLKCCVIMVVKDFFLARFAARPRTKFQLANSVYLMVVFDTLVVVKTRVCVCIDESTIIFSGTAARIDSQESK